ncbi:hypothetical protein KUTeg_004853 [Tegillarca granosa]|uniref:Uncharacterized protein n=1 Tax=Tegillarca granosa TaxID=220873 RepID=A0ABQ9FI55_TEGGR|nr:hypothetical protein KUTeg_004853 [Tegillarca granosa]
MLVTEWNSSKWTKTRRTERSIQRLIVLPLLHLLQVKMVLHQTDSIDMENLTVILKVTPGEDNKDKNSSIPSGLSPSFSKSVETQPLLKPLNTILNKTDETLKKYSKELNKKQTTLEVNEKETDVSNRSDSSALSKNWGKIEPPNDGQFVTETGSMNKILSDDIESSTKDIKEDKGHQNVYKISPITFVKCDDVEGISRSINISVSSSSKNLTTEANKTPEYLGNKKVTQEKGNITLREPENTDKKGARFSNEERSSGKDEVSSLGKDEGSSSGKDEGSSLVKDEGSSFVKDEGSGSENFIAKKIGGSASRYDQKNRVYNEISRDLFHDTIKDAQIRLQSVLQKLDHTDKTEKHFSEFNLQSERVLKGREEMNSRESKASRNSKDKTGKLPLPKKYSGDKPKFNKELIFHCNICDTEFLFGQICENCRVLACLGCFGRIHPSFSEEKLKNHVVSIVTKYDLKEEMCSVHNLLFSYYCTTCKKKKCSDCCALSHECRQNTIIKLEEHINNERENLAKLQKETSSKCVQKTDMMLSLLDDKAEEIQKCSIPHLLLYFSFKQPFDFEVHSKTIIEKRWEKLLKQTQKLQTIGDNLNPPFLEQKVLLYEEKRHLQECLDKQNFGSMRVQPYSSCIYLSEDIIDSPIIASELWKPPVTLSSTYIGYDVQIKLHMKIVLWNTKSPIDINEAVFNESGKVFLLPNQRYLVKVTPVTTINGVLSSLNRGKPCFILLVTGKLKKKLYANDE